MLLWLQERVRDCLAQAAMTDALTGALNRHGALPMLERELAPAARSGRPVWVVCATSITSSRSTTATAITWVTWCSAVS